MGDGSTVEGLKVVADLFATPDGLLQHTTNLHNNTDTLVKIHIAWIIILQDKDNILLKDRTASLIMQDNRNTEIKDRMDLHIMTQRKVRAKVSIFCPYLETDHIGGGYQPPDYPPAVRK